MAFSSIVIGANTFNSIGRGEYSLSGLSFDAPKDLVKITPGRATKVSTMTATGAVLGSKTDGSVSRHKEKDITVGSFVARRKASVVLNFSVPEGFTAAEIDTLVADISTFLDTTTLTRILLGES